MRSDCCAFGRVVRDQNQKVIRASSFVVVYVDDLLWAADKEDFELLVRTLSQLEVGPITRLSPRNPIEFLGTQIVMDRVGNLGIHMQSFILSMGEMKISDLIEKGKRIASL